MRAGARLGASSNAAAPDGGSHPFIIGTLGGTSALGHGRVEGWCVVAGWAIRATQHCSQVVWTQPARAVTVLWHRRLPGACDAAKRNPERGSCLHGAFFLVTTFEELRPGTGPRVGRVVLSLFRARVLRARTRSRAYCTAQYSCPKAVHTKPVGYLVRPALSERN